MSNLPREPLNCKEYNLVYQNCPASFNPRPEICRVCNRWIPFNKDDKRAFLSKEDNCSDRKSCDCEGCDCREK